MHNCFWIRVNCKRITDQVFIHPTDAASLDAVIIPLDCIASDNNLPAVLDKAAHQDTVKNKFSGIGDKVDISPRQIQPPLIAQ